MEKWRKTITAGGLIEILKKSDPATPVFIQGYEGGVENLEHINHCLIAIEGNPYPYCGPHEKIYPSQVDEYAQNGHRVVTGILFTRIEPEKED